MQPEEKAAIKAASTTALIAGAFAATIATPVAWAAVMLGAYRMGKSAYDRAKQERLQQEYFKNH